MIVFNTLRYKNFLSTGDTFTEIDFRSAPATLVTGSNGAGKSTMLDALSFVLFGKAHRNINKPQLVNSINQKKCVVEVEFSTGQKEFLVRRGITPAVFEIYQNGQLVDQASTARDYQLFLEQNVLKMNYKTFHQVVVLGSSSFTPFMQLTALHRRAVIENLLDISVFTEMNKVLKESTSSLKDELRETTVLYDRKSMEETIQASHIEELESMSDEMIADKQEQIKTLTAKGEALTSKSDILTDKIESATKEYNKYRTEIESNLKVIRSELSSYQSENKITSRQLTFFKDKDECPTCTQDIDSEFKESKIEELTASKQKQDESIETLSQRRDKELKLMDELSGVMDAINRDQRKLSGYRAEVKGLASQIKSLQSEITKLQNKSDEIEESKSKLADVTKEISQLEKKKNDLNEQLLYNSVASEMLKDTGIKTKIIKQYLPVINKYINEYLHVLDFFAMFEMDENFNETILSRHRDSFSYASFSEGEKQRIDLAILFTWRQVAKMKNSVATNLLILDETFDSSLDTDGIDNLMKILSTLDSDTNVFVISHKGHLMAEKFEHGIKFEKVNNFSVMKEN